MFQLMIMAILMEDVDTLKNIVINSIWLFSIKYWYKSHIILQCAVLPNAVDDNMLQHFNAHLYRHSPWGWLLSLAEICHRVTDVYVNLKKMHYLETDIFLQRESYLVIFWLVFWIRCRNFIELYTSSLFLCHFMLLVLGKERTQVVRMKACHVTHPTYIVLHPTLNIAKWECSDRGPIDRMQGRILGCFVWVEEIQWRDHSCCSWFLQSEFVCLTQWMYCYRLLVSISCRQVMGSAGIISSDEAVAQ